MCGTACHCRSERGCALSRVELNERVLRMSFTPRPEPVDAVLPTPIGLP